ncbi:hypothetical protein POSPLADRAFT_1152612 [Postia placenta MAD-698-R-SB12]|uniref:C2H2-type domain-containing protein n=1 Tax=Postia placenta MAD-698-R-SB12 TaxID=670580 RepID=A0A1X6MQA0_9APHY|nr:hypothetical protein POSPLADRAFT_1152612 [Postia placenta MAD-698-R-SB12]OSX58594.1 hypothetical protein POSPLADRAFT_1152612 [Postia placenta MAD-698-R-SB12]
MAYCERCQRWFGSERALQQHEENSSMHHLCDSCDRDFVSEHALIQHYVQSTRHHYCQRCDEHYSSQGNLDSHFESSHYWCPACNMFFKNDNGLHEHRRQKHWYCIECKRVYQSESNLRAHQRSSVHQQANIPCVDTRCNRKFVSVSALALHLESGTCPSRLTRAQINRLVARYDTNNVITDPARLIQGPNGYSTLQRTVTAWATERSWNGSAYECFLCHKMYTTLAVLNQHLASPAHDDKIYRCPRAYSGCGETFRALSALCQHVESEQCGIRRFNHSMRNVLADLSTGMARLTF